MTTVISAIGTATPPFTQDQQVTAEKIATALALKPSEKRLLKSVYQATGIAKRHSVLGDFCRTEGNYEFFPNDAALPFPSTSQRMNIYKQHALPLAIQAVNNCLDSLKNFDLSDITHVITISCTGMYAPGLDIELVQHLKLSSDAKRTCVNFMGCYGAFNGIKLADSICQASPQAKVLLVSVELCTIHFQKNDSMDNIISNAIFSDGAAAAIIETKKDRSKYLKLDAFYCDLLPQNAKDMTWHIGDSGFDIVLSTYVPEAIESGIAEFIQRLLIKNNLAFSEIDYFAIHPGGKKILEACEKALNISKEDNRYSYKVLKDYGNMSSATVLFVLKSIWDELGETQEPKKLFSCAFGPGLTLESMLLST